MSEAMVAQFSAPGVVSREERVLAIEGNRPDGALDTVVVDLDPAPKAIPPKWL